MYGIEKFLMTNSRLVAARSWIEGVNSCFFTCEGNALEFAVMFVQLYKYLKSKIVCEIYLKEI